MQQKGSFLIISLLVSALIIAGVTIYELQGGWNSKPTNYGYVGDINQAKEAQIQADFKAIQTALETYKINKGQYPDNLSQLVELGQLSKVPINPYSQKEFDFSSDGKSYTLSTKLGDNTDYQITD